MIEVGMEVTILSMYGHAHASVVERSPGKNMLVAYYPSGDERSPYVFVVRDEDEGVHWIRGRDPEAVDALRTAWALGQSPSELPPGWTSSTYAITFSSEP